MKLLVSEYLIILAIITWQESDKGQKLPSPSRYWKASVGFGLLAVGSPIIGEALAGALGGGLLLALLYNQYNSKDKTPNQTGGGGVIHKKQ